MEHRSCRVSPGMIAWVFVGALEIAALKVMSIKTDHWLWLKAKSQLKCFVLGTRVHCDVPPQFALAGIAVAALLLATPSGKDERTVARIVLFGSLFVVLFRFIPI